MPIDINDLDLGEVKEKKVIEAIVKEINTFGENTKKNFEALRTDYEGFKKEMEKPQDGLVKEAVTKYAEAITTRQTVLDEGLQEQDKKLNERLDQIEVALKRPGIIGTDSSDKAVQEAIDFHKRVLAVNTEGATYRKMKGYEPNMEEYKEYLKAFYEYIRLGGQASNELYVDPESMKALLVGSDPDGGVTVPTAMSQRVIQKIFESDPIRQLAAVESITTAAIEWMVEQDEAGAEWESETVATDDRTTPTFKKKRIPVHPLATRPKITQQLIEDSGINIENWLANKVGQKFGRTEAASFVTGDGIGKPRGFLTYPTGTSWAQIEQVNMGNANLLTADGFTTIKYSLVEDLLNRGTWLLNRTTVMAAMKLKNGVGDYIWKPSMIAGDPGSAILNLPVRMSTTMPEVAADALAIALADWAEAYMIVDRLGITVQRDPFTQKPFIEFYFRKRVGGDVVNYQAIKIGKIAA